MAGAFTYTAPTSEFAGTIARMLQQRGLVAADAAQRIGDIQARATEQSGNAWAGAAAGIGRDVGGTIAQLTDPRRSLDAERVKAAQGQAAETARLRSGQQAVDTMMAGDQLPAADAGPRQPSFVDAQGLFDVPKITQRLAATGYGHLTPDLVKSAEAINSSITAHQADEQKLGQTSTLLLGDMADAAQKLIKGGMAPGDALDLAAQPALATKRITPDQYAQRKAQLLALPPAQQTAALTTLMDAAAQVSPEKTVTKDAIVTDRYNRSVASNVVPDKPTEASLDADAQALMAKANAGGTLTPTEAASLKAYNDRKAPRTTKAIESKNVLLDGKPAIVNFNPADGTHTLPDGTDVSTRVKPIPAASTIINPAALNDVKETVAGMKDGSLPPLMPGRATKEYLATMAEAHRQGYDLQGAVTDWNATQKHLASMNGAQQLRLNQAINSLPEMLDSVDALAAQWKGGRFPILNRANLALAKGGAYGTDVASVANKLDAQIADVTADLGNVYMGGNSPTEEALKLAGKSLHGDWNEKVLHDMVSLARQNVTIRGNSIKHTGVSGASDRNPYATQTPAAAPEEWVWNAAHTALVKKAQP